MNTRSKMTIVLFFLTQFLTAQEQSAAKKSSINVSFGLSIPFNLNLNYERLLSNASYASIGAGKFLTMGGTANHIDFTHFFLKGKNGHYLEYGYGLLFIDPFSDFGLLPNARIGYRKTSTSNSRYFRLGFSISEGIYFSRGLVF